MIEAIPINDQTWLVCGGRRFADQDMFDGAMSDLVRIRGMPRVVIHGGAKGADMMGAIWAVKHAITCVAFSPDWNKHGKAAGPIRNQEMIDDGKPKMVIAFPGGRGTSDMVDRARKSGIDVAEIKPK